MPDTLARLDAVIERTARHKDAALLAVRRLIAEDERGRADPDELHAAHREAIKWSRRHSRWVELRRGKRTTPPANRGKYVRETHAHSKTRDRVAAALAAMDCPTV